MQPHIHKCPHCGAPLSPPPNAWAVRCDFCKVDVSLLGVGPQTAHAPVLQVPIPAAPPSAAAIFLRKAWLPICSATFGVIFLPTFYFLDRNDTTDRAVVIAVVASIAAFVLHGTGRRIVACVLAMIVGLVLLAKPFVRPVVWDNHTLSLDSETHYYFLIPGIAMLGVFGLMLLLAFEQRTSESKDSRVLRIFASVVFVVGIVLGHLTFGGPTVRDVMTQYESQGAAMRKQFIKLAAKLPGVGDVKPRESKLEPAPVWIEGQPKGNNIEIVTVEELWNPDDSPNTRNLYLSDDLVNCVRWTGPKNPMSSTVMGDRAGDFSERMARAFGLPWIAAYRSGTTGIEIFVFDMRSQSIAAATIAKGTSGDFTQDRKLVLDALTKATGGTFRLK